LARVSDPKATLRKLARARRAELALAVPDFATRIAAYAGALNIPDDTLIGAYIALPGEADPHLLLKKLAGKSCSLAFPRVHAKGEPLVFHHWQPGDVLVKGAYGIAEPSPDWPVAHPPVLLVPLLAFDKTGHRLGYGGGFYDRTIASLKPARTIGVAYAGQEAETLPHEPHDVPLDMVITEEGVRRFA
jgi:5-formyltetrahydrofolate cyclo-ligase